MTDTASGPWEDQPLVPEGMRPDAAETWPPRELIDSFLSGYEVEMWPGETLTVDSEAEAERARHFRNTLGRFASGVTIITSISNDEPVGMTCQSFMSVSLDPPLVVFSPAKTSRAYSAIRAAGKFCVNFLGSEMSEISNQFAMRGADKYEGVEWQPAPATGMPLLKGVTGYVDCTIEQVLDAGDHYLVVGRVQALDSGDADDALTFYQGQYGSVPGRG